MPTPTRARAVQTLTDGWDHLHELLARIDAASFDVRGTIGGGEWSAKDLLGHVAFWEEIAVVQIGFWRQGQVLRLDQEFAPGGTDGLNAWNQRRQHRRSVRRVRTESDRIHARLLGEIGRLTETEWRSIVPLPLAQRVRLGTRLGRLAGGPAGPFGHVEAHLPDLRAFVATLPDEMM